MAEIIQPNWYERALSKIAPRYALQQYKTRSMFAMFGGYEGASHSKRAFSEWSTQNRDADSALLWDVQTLRNRSSDLIRNNPLAAGVLNTKVTAIVGAGLQYKSSIHREQLGLSDDQADAWESLAGWEFRMACKHLDITGHSSFYGLQDIALRSTFEKGDCFALLTAKTRINTPYKLAVQLIEAERVSNPNFKQNTLKMAGGVEKDATGEAVAYQICSSHPGSLAQTKGEWVRRLARNKKGHRNILHLHRPLRPGQTRGVPDLAPVIEAFKQLGRYTEAELMAAVIGGMFTVFIKSESDDLLGAVPGEETGKDSEYKLGNGGIVGLAPGESFDVANPGRPNQAFDPFVMAILRQIGVALELPMEILIKHFTSSYSASRAALLEAWRYFMTRRVWFADAFCQPIYEAFVDEAVALGRLTAPGYFADPMVREAYLGAEWTGPARGQIDELKEAKAARELNAMGVKTLEQITTETTGGDWERNHKQQVKERQRRRDDGLEDQRIGGVVSDGDSGDVAGGSPSGDAGGDVNDMMNSYGIGVRAGAITPQIMDEHHFRAEIGLPELSDDVSSAWDDDGGVRRPITLKSGEEFAALSDAAVEASDGEEEEIDEN